MNKQDKIVIGHFIVKNVEGLKDSKTQVSISFFEYDNRLMFNIRFIIKDFLENDQILNHIRNIEKKICFPIRLKEHQSIRFPNYVTGHIYNIESNFEKVITALKESKEFEISIDDIGKIKQAYVMKKLW